MAKKKLTPEREKLIQESAAIPKKYEVVYQKLIDEDSYDFEDIKAEPETNYYDSVNKAKFYSKVGKKDYITFDAVQVKCYRLDTPSPEVMFTITYMNGKKMFTIRY